MPELGRVGASLALLGAVGVGPVAAQSSDWYEMSASRQIGVLRALEAEFEYAAGTLHVSAAPSGRLYETRLRYDSRSFEPVRNWSVSEGTGRLSMSLSSLDDNWDLEEFDDSNLGALEVNLSREVPTSLTMLVGAATVEMELGGLALQRFSFKTGASETRISFDQPNPVRMDRLELAAGAADFRAASLGNGRFDYFEFTGAVGDVSLDFSGQWSGSASGDIRMGLGSLTLRFPRSLAVRIEKKGLLASFDSSGFESVAGGYQTPNWDTASSRLTLEIRAAFGDIDVDFVN